MDRRRHDALAALVGAAASAAWLTAALAVLAGSLRPWVGVGALVAGACLGLVIARCSLTEPEPLTLAQKVALAAFAAVSVRQFGWLLFERHGALLTLLPYNYGDLPLHWTYVQYLARGAEFWPRNPVFASTPLVYPLGVDLLTAVAVQLGLGLPAVLRAGGIACALLAAVALRRWGGAFAVAGFLFSGGLAGLQVFLTGRLIDYQAAVEWKNLYLTLFVPQRGFLLALPLGLLLLWSWRGRLLRGEAGLPAWVEGVLWGTLPLLHLHSFAMLSVLFAVWTIGGGRWTAAAPTLAVALAPASWAVWQVTNGFQVGSMVGWQPGWTMGEANPLVFLLVNFGIFLPLALVALATAIQEGRREEVLVLGPALAVLALLFLFRLAPWAWDNTKVMLWCYLAVLPSIDRLALARVKPVPRVALVAVFLFSGAQSVLATSVGGQRLEVLDRAEHEGVCRAVAALEPGEPVATAQVHNHPVALCGQPLVAGYGGHLWSHGIAARPVEERLELLMKGSHDYREQARGLGTRYVFWGRREQAAFPDSREAWKAAGPPVASGDWGALYRVD